MTAESQSVLPGPSAGGARAHQLLTASTSGLRVVAAWLSEPGLPDDVGAGVQSEYAPDCDARRHWLSRFTGSAGTAVVTASTAALWTDGRYFLQASQQLGPAWTLMRGGSPGCPDIPDWLAGAVPEGGRVGIDPFVHTVRVDSMSVPVPCHGCQAAGPCRWQDATGRRHKHAVQRGRADDVCSHCPAAMHSARSSSSKASPSLIAPKQTICHRSLSRGQVDNALALDNKLSAAGRSLVPLTAGNLVDAVWGAERPPPPAAPLRTHALEHAGESAGDKIRRMRQEMAGARPNARTSGVFRASLGTLVLASPVGAGMPPMQGVGGRPRLSPRAWKRADRQTSRQAQDPVRARVQAAARG